MVSVGAVRLGLNDSVGDGVTFGLVLGDEDLGGQNGDFLSTFRFVIAITCLKINFYQAI